MQLTLQLCLPDFKAGPDCYPALKARDSTVEAWHPPKRFLVRNTLNECQSIWDCNKISEKQGGATQYAIVLPLECELKGYCL